MLDLAVEYKVKRFFWPSSIAAFGPNTPRVDTPQHTIMNPTTMYGVSKVSGELLCQYYYKKYGLDTRSLRYPGVVSRKTLP
jgi:nucleoside-diphosphate-sugar epimerase